MPTTSLPASPLPAVGLRSGRNVYLLVLLTLMYTCLTIDRGIVSVLLGPIKAEFGVSDSMLGFLALSFSLIYAVAGVPLGLLSDRGYRKQVLVGCLVFFSAMTSACGMVQSYAQLLLARFGVGAGEAGCGPAALSMITDRFPPEQRSIATSLYYLSLPLAFLAVFAGGGWMVSHYGWRSVFIVAGIPGLLVAALIWIAFRDSAAASPAAPTARAERAGLQATLQMIRGHRSLLHLIAAIVLSSVSVAIVNVWVIAFLERSHGMPLAQSGWLVGLMFGGISLIGIAGGGALADWLGRDHPQRRLALLMAASLVSAPLLAWMMASTQIWSMTLAFGLWSITAYIWFGPAYAISQSLAAPQQRATLGSLIYLGTGVIGAGLGPQAVGMLSDALTPSFQANALRWAVLAIAALAHLGAAVHYALACGRTGHSRRPPQPLTTEAFQ